MRLRARCGPHPGLLKLLSSHPYVERAEEADLQGIEFIQGTWSRRVLAGSRDCAIKGLVELMDNNPLVCADEASVPSPASTLALVALGPALRAGIVEAEPELRFDFSADEGDVSLYLETCGWGQGCIARAGARAPSGVLICEARAKVGSRATLQDVVGLYDEAFGRAFYVRRQEGDGWLPESVEGASFALYTVGVESDAEVALVIRAAADAQGKCGASQLVHCMNVMAGFEESLGIPD